MIDIGVRNNIKKQDRKYETFYLKDLEAGDTMEAPVEITPLKSKTIKKGSRTSNADEFYMILKDEQLGIKWELGILATVYRDNPKEPVIYATEGGRLYILIDSLMNAVNGTPRNAQPSYRVDFNTFQGIFQNKIEKLEVKIIKATNSRATAPNVEIIGATLKG